MLKLVESGYGINLNSITVKDFGAVGDGVTDDTQAFENAITYAVANHRSIYVPMGIYVLTQLVLPDETNLIGEYFTTAPINRDGPTLAFTTLAATEKAITIGSNSTLQNLVIQGSSKDTAGTYGVYGGLLSSEGLGTYTNIINCYFEECSFLTCHKLKIALCVLTDIFAKCGHLLQIQ